MSDLPKLSVRLHGGIEPGRCITLAKTAEAQGFHSVWFAENAFNRGVLPAASACAAATSRIGIGIGVFNPYNRHPTLIAMEIGALDELARGRARLGIGSGIAAATERMGLSADRPLAAVRDAITIVRAMLKGEEVTYTGKVFSAHGAKLEYQPPRPDMPLLMAARGEQALALCGAIADGLMISNMCPPGFTRQAVEVIRKSALAAGRAEPAEVVQYVPCAVRPDRAQAHALAKATIARDAAGILVAGPTGAGGEVGVAAGRGSVGGRFRCRGRSPARGGSAGGCARRALRRGFRDRRHRGRRARPGAALP